MRKTGRVMAGACALLALGATTALAGDEFQLPENKYEGRLDRGDRGTYVGFNLKRAAKTVVKKVAVSAPFECRSGNSGYEQFPVTGRFKVDDDGTFGERVRYDFRGVRLRVKFEGELLRRGRAKGEFKFVARPPGMARRGSDRCTFERLDWRAKRGKEITVVEPL